MIALLSSTCITLFLCFSIASFLTQKLKISVGFIETSLVGLAFTNTISSFVSIFFPLNIYTLKILLLVSFIFSITNFSTLFDFTKKLKRHKFTLFISAPFIVWGFINALSAPLNPDTPLYHMQAIKWIGEYAAVPGLANLHSRFGFNPNVFTLYGLTSLKEVFNQEIFSINFLLFCLFVFYYLKNSFEYFNNDGFSKLFFFNFVLFLNILALVFSISSPTPDFLCIWIPVFIFSKIINEKYTLQILTFNEFAFIVVKTTYCITVKLASFPLFILPIAILFFKQYPLQKLAVLALFCIIILTPWLVRNVIISGWLVYPLPIIDLFDVDWKIPIGKVIKEKDLIIGFARNGKDHVIEASKMSVHEWITQWWQVVYNYERVIFVMATFIPIFIIIMIYLRKIVANKVSIIVLLTAYLGFIIWFFLAPDFRFGKAFILLSALAPLYIIQNNLVIFKRKLPKSNLLFLGLIAIIFSIILYKSRFFTIQNSMELGERIIKPAPMEIPESIDFSSIQVNGFSIYYPKIDDECYNHPLPCGAYIYDKIEMRGSKIADGFVAQ